MCILSQNNRYDITSQVLQKESAVSTYFVTIARRFDSATLHWSLIEVSPLHAQLSQHAMIDNRSTTLDREGHIAYTVATDNRYNIDIMEIMMLR